MHRLAAAVFAAAQLLPAASSYVSSIEAWRVERESKLKAPDGWLTVAGLFWLREGENRAGADPSYEIVLPKGRAPQRIGVFDFENGAVRFRVASKAAVTVNGKLVATASLRPDTAGDPDLVQVGDFTMFVIKRGDRYGIRLRDIHSSMRSEFTRLRWFPVKEGYRIEAQWVPYDQPRNISVPNILGQVEEQPSPGYATFKLGGRTLRLDPVLEDNRLFFIFRDATTGKSTYGAGRFLYSDLPKDGRVTLDFNKAYTPPCAFTPYATCPLPPKQNRLTVAIEAGELNYGNH
jgi:uncharacterized protein (DUF1684 family)